MKFSDRLREIFFLIGSSLMFNFPAFFNGYPLVTSDSGTYMSCGIGPVVPSDRPVLYGLFVRHISMRESMWFVVIAQGIIAAWILSQAIKQFLPEYSKRLHRFFIFLSISILTTLPWFNSQIMADFFAPIPAICIALLLLAPFQTLTQKIFTSIILLFSVLTHNSHLLEYSLLIIIFGIVIISKKYFRKGILSGKRFLLVSILVLSSWIISPFINFLIDGKYRLSGSSHVFLVARLAETGILNDYLKRNCNCNDVLSLSDTSKYIIITKQSKMCLDVEAAQQKDSARVQQWYYVRGNNQKFHFVSAGNDLYKISALHSGKVLSLLQPAANSVSTLVQATDTGGAGQRFKLVKANDNYFFIQSPINDEVLDVKDFSTKIGAFVQLFYKTGADNQLFRIMPDTTGQLCFYQGQIPTNTIDFIWAENSIFWRTGAWDNSEKEYNEVLKGILLSPRYFLWNLRESIVSTFRQLTRFDVGSGLLIYGENSSPGYNVKNNYRKDFNSYMNSQQNSYGFNFNETNKRVFITMIISSIILLLFFYKKENKTKKRELWFLSVICIYSVILNAFVSGAMANVLDRLQSRIVWLIPFCAILLTYDSLIILAKRLKNKINPE